jgi:micrococcal nuclease
MEAGAQAHDHPVIPEEERGRMTMTSCTAVCRSAVRLLALVIALLVATPAAGTEAERHRVSAHVVRVHDGDTLVARLAAARHGLRTVRLVGIDCPESAQRWGSQATGRLAALVLGRPVILELAIQPRDGHGRLLAGVYLDDAKTLVQEVLVREGLCLTFVIPPNIQYVGRLRAAQTDAQRAERGIWARIGGLRESPADYRHRHR